MHTKPAPRTGSTDLPRDNQAQPSPAQPARGDVISRKGKMDLDRTAPHPGTCIAYAGCTRLERRTWPYLVCVFLDAFCQWSLLFPVRVREIRSTTTGKSTLYTLTGCKVHPALASGFGAASLCRLERDSGGLWPGLIGSNYERLGET